MENAFPVLGKPQFPRGKELLVKGLSVLHESLADYILQNPGCTLRELGGHFGYTAPWICTVLGTDMFKAYMRERRNNVASMVEQDLPAKLHAAAHLATERLIEQLTTTNDPDFLLESFDKVLHRYGFAPNAKTGAQAAVVNNTQINHFTVEKSDLDEARQALINGHSNPSGTQQLRVIEAGSEPADGV